MVREGHRKGRLYSYLACTSLMATALLAPRLGAAAEPLNIEPTSQIVVTSVAAEEYGGMLEAGAFWAATSGEVSVVVGVSELFHTAEARSRQFIADQDRMIRVGLSGWFATQSSIAGEQGNTLLSSSDGGLSVGVGVDELSVDWTVKF